MDDSLHGKTVVNRYVIQRKLGTGGFGAVYESFDRLDRELVAFKHITREGEEEADGETDSASGTEERLALANEFQTLASLRHPNIIGVLDYGFDADQQPFFTMQLIPKARTLTEAASRLRARHKIELVVQLLQALLYLHRRGVIHRDLKPSNTLITPDGVVKVLDFGLAIKKREAHDEGEELKVAGTLDYIAPEVLAGYDPNEASDLYAVGVMMYELFVGHLPFGSDDFGEFLHQILHAPPDTRLLDAIDFSAEAEQAEIAIQQAKTDVIIRPDPAKVTEVPTQVHVEPPDNDWDLDSEAQTRTEVYNHQLTDSISKPIDKVKSSEPPRSSEGSDEKVSIRSITERLLAKDPYKRYSDAQEVIRALSQATGDVYLTETIEIRESYLQAAQFIGREKEWAQLSNALDDMLMGKGAACLIGGESGVGKSRLIEELRTTAMVKGAIVLHGQGVAGGGLPYQLWRDPLRRLLLSVNMSDEVAAVLKQIVPDISDLLERPIPDAPELEGAAGNQRLLNAIADMFRAYKQPIVLVLEDLQWAIESLEVLKYLLPMIERWSVLVVGSYRNDEAPKLHEEFPQMELITLERFSESTIEKLSVSMLGDAGREPHVLGLLKKETEGNVFFLIEVVRALAEEAGRLSEIAQMTLPATVFAGGVQAVVQRRLGRVSAADRQLLTLAALAGRQIDLKLLHFLAPQSDLDHWLTVCSNAAILDVHQEHWRFAHDKLREGLLGLVAADERRVLHHRIAAGMEAVYADEQNAYAAIIADHYEQAGEVALASEWHLRAGIFAEESFVYTAAIEHFQKALAQWDKGVAASPHKQLEVYHRLGKMLNRRAQYAEALDLRIKMLQLAIDANDPLAQARARVGMGWANLFLGNFREALDHAAQGVNLARANHEPDSLSEGLMVQGWAELSLGEMDKALTLSEEAVQVAERMGNKVRISDTLNLLGAVRSSTGRYDEGGKVFERALAIAEELGDLLSATILISNLGLVAMERGDYQAAVGRFQEVLAFARQSGDRNSEINYLFNLGTAQVGMGDYDAATGNLYQVIWLTEGTTYRELSPTYRALAEAAIGQNRLEDAREAAVQALQKGREVESPEYIGGAWRVLGQVASLLGMPLYLPSDELNEDTVDMIRADACFAQSDAIFAEKGLDNQRARTLREWARHDRRKGDSASAGVKWQEAREIFQRIGADLEAKDMQDPATNSRL